MDEPILFKKLLALGATFSVDNLFVKCDNGRGVGVDLKNVIDDFVTSGLITIKCPKGKELKYSLKELFRNLDDSNKPVICPLCKTTKVYLATFSVKVKGLIIPYPKIHDFLEHPKEVEGDKVVAKLKELLK